MLQLLRDRFREINKIAEKDGVVLLGSNYFTDFPVNELAQKYDDDASASSPVSTE